MSLVSTTKQDGWRYDFYRDTRYPCSISGFQTFTVARKAGSSSTASRPLWTYLHGGGVGYFDAQGIPRDSSKYMTEEPSSSQRKDLAGGGLFSRVRDNGTAFRMLAVSYCNRDLYGGAGYPDPNNPNRLPDGSRRTTNGLLSTRAAVQFVQGRYPTDEVFLHGTSAGSVGALGAAWRFQRHGIDVAGVVADASVVNREMTDAARAQQLCAKGPDRSAEIGARVHPDLADIDNEVDKLVTRGQLRAPVLHTWVRGCGEVPVTCPLRDGSTVTMGAFDCIHEPLRAAIEAQGPASRSTNLRLCVDDPNRPAACDQHVVTARDGMTNTDPSSRPNYLWTIMEWVRARLADA